MIFKKSKSEENRDALAKAIFEHTFNWLVKRMNFTTLPEEDLEEGADLVALDESRLEIGLLDIFGFECFEVNSFE